MTIGLTRRRFLAGATIGSAGVAIASCTSNNSPPPAAKRKDQAKTKNTGLQRFVSRPDLIPPTIKVAGSAPPGTPGYILLTPNGKGHGQSGSMITSTSGDLVWFAPTSSSQSRLDFAVQSYDGQPMLTWYQGPIINGHGEGIAVIADSSYQQTQVVRAARGLETDLHEFAITAYGTAFITAYRQSPADLSALGGPAKGAVLSGVAQEIDLATGKLLFEWDSLNHVALTESHLKLAGGTAAKPFDYFHINSIAVAPDGDLLISARNTWAVYKVARPSGQVVWRLGGKRSDFKLGPDVQFYWQHHVRPHGSSTLSIFDDGAAPPEEKSSRALLVDLNTQTMQASLAQQYIHPRLPTKNYVLAAAMGSAQVLPDGGMFVGWGTEPRFTLFANDGEIQLDGEIGASKRSYRAFLFDWVGHPAERPAAAAKSRSGGATVYASWNGATEVASWAVLAGSTTHSLRHVGRARRTGFETAVRVNDTGPHFVAVALNAAGRELARSAHVTLG